MPKKILVIDDEEILTRTYVKLLTLKGYDTYFVKSGDDAVEIVQEIDFDLIITDIRMPGLNGFETLKTIRRFYNENGKSHPPEIVITGFTSEDIEKEIKNLSPSAYMYKPFDMSELLDHVAKVLK